MSLCNSVDLVLNFLEVAVHQILYHRRVYVKRAFRKDMHYGVYTRWCVVDSVTQYVKSTLNSLRNLIDKNVEQFVVVITSKRPNCVPIERFVFNLKFPLNSMGMADAEEFCKQCALTLTKLRINADCSGVNMPAVNRGDGTDVEFRMFALGDQEGDLQQNQNQQLFSSNNSQWIRIHDVNYKIDNPVIIPNSRIAVPIHRIKDQNNADKQIESVLCVFVHAEIV